MRNNKQSKLKGENSIEFILPLSVDHAHEKLQHNTELYIVQLDSKPEHYYFEISDFHHAKKHNIYVLMKVWNNTDTLVTVSANPQNVAYNPSMILLSAVTIFISLAVLIIFQFNIAFMVIWLAAMITGIYNLRNGVGRISYKPTNTTDEKTRTKEKLMNTVVKVLSDNVEVYPINY